MNARRLLLALAMSLAASGVALAEQKSICAEPEFIIDYPDCPDCKATLPRALPVARFAFDKNAIAKMSNITSIQFQFTMEGGDTLPGQLDYDKLTLGLGGVDTGLKLNGFSGSGENTVNFDWNPTTGGWPSDASLQRILADIKDDGLIDASIIDATPDDNHVNLYSANVAKLCITGDVPSATGVPEPASMLAWFVAGPAVALLRRRSKRRSN